jgi:Flp pilus assembly protein CpaB
MCAAAPTTGGTRGRRALSETPESPRAARLAAPRWLDTRLVLGVLLVLVSVVVGARVLSSADRSTLVWAVARDLSAGSQLTASDLQQVRVRLFDSAGQYVAVDAGAPPTGYVVRRALGSGELLPRASLAVPGEDVDYRHVTVAVAAGHLPPQLDDGQQVDVWVTPETKSGAASPAPTGDATAQLVLQGVTVLGVQRDAGAFSGSTTIPVVLQVRPDEVARLVSAMSAGRLDLVRVPRPVEAAGRLAPGAGSG